MDSKLTLLVDSEVIQQAKDFAKKNHTSLSKLFEHYLASLTRTETAATEEISPLVRSLSGVIKDQGNFDQKKSRTKYLAEKYK